MGLHGDMELQTASGPLKIAEMCDRSVRNPDYSEVVFIWTGARLFFSEASDFRCVGTEQLFEVGLDDGSTVLASASSKFIMRTGFTKIAPELKPGDSLLPLYLGVDYHGYPTYKVPGHHVKRKIYRLMAEWKQGQPLQKGTEVKHIDGNRKNYHPDNLLITPNKRSTKRRRKNKLGKAFQDVHQFLSECAEASPIIAEIAGKDGGNNHKVESIRPGRLSEVFTASVRFEGSVSVSGVFLELPA